MTYSGSVIEMKHLRLLDAVERNGTLSAAAKELGFTQPALTQQMQSLEDTVGTPIVIRSSSGVRLTEAGNVLLRHGRKVLDAMALAQAEVDAITTMQAGHARVACFPSAAATLIPPAFGALHQEFPKLRFGLLEADTDEALSALRRGDVDVAVIYHYEPEIGAPLKLLSEERAFPILTEEIWLALPRDHGLAGADQVSLTDVSDARWVAGCPSCRGNLNSMTSRADFTPEVAFETDDYVALHSLVAQGLGVALVPDLMRRAARQEEGVAFARCEPASKRIVQAVTTERLAEVPAIRHLLNALAPQAPLEAPDTKESSGVFV